MAVISVKQMPPREGQAESQRNNLLYEVIGRRYRVELIVKTDTHKDGSNVVLKDSRIPKIGDMYTARWGNDSDTVATCVRLVANATKNRKIWVVVAEFDTDRIVAAMTDNPLNQPPEIDWDFESYERPMVRDVFGVPLRSTSNNAFDPPWMRELRYPVCRVTRNEANFSKDQANQYAMKLNKYTFAGYDQLCARINHMTGRRRLTNGVLHWQVTYEVEFRSETFWQYVLDQDFRDADRMLFRDKRDQSPLSNMTPLNGRGRSIFDSFTLLTDNIGPLDFFIVIPTPDVIKFPPALKPKNQDGIIPGPWYNFKVRIDDEVMEVVSGHGTNTWGIIRGVDGTFPAAHAAGATIYLEPYFIRFLPWNYVDFAPLALPIV